MSAFDKYFSEIVSGKITACESMKRIAQKLLDLKSKPGKYHFDEKLAARPIEFIETFCKQPAGQIGKPLKLQLFQKARIEAIFGFVDDDNFRQYNEVLIIEGRKNGKTSETSAIELYMLVADGEGAPQIYNVATKHDQAKLGFNAAWSMQKQSPLLKKHVRKRATDLYFPANMGFIKAIASDTATMDGLDTHCGVVDELAAIKNRDIYDLIKQSMGARRQPLFFTISTNGFVRHGVFDAQVEYAKKILSGAIENERFLPFIYELDHPDEWTDPKCWIKANPGLGTIKKTDYLVEMVEKAKVDSSFKPTVLVKDFNVPQTAESAWLAWEELDNQDVADTKYDYCIGGFDAADTVDLNFAVALCAKADDPKIVIPYAMAWIPEEVLKRQELTGIRTERDKVPYSLWIEKGYMRTCPGHKCDKRIFLEWFKELKYEHDLYPLMIGYDPWHIDDSLLRDFEAEFGKNAMIPVRQGAKTLSEPMKNLKADFKNGNIIYQNNPILKWCFSNTMVKADINGNIQPVKQTDQTQRIDGAVAAIIAYTVFQDNKDKYINLN